MHSRRWWPTEELSGSTQRVVLQERTASRSKLIARHSVTAPESIALADTTTPSMVAPAPIFKAVVDVTLPTICVSAPLPCAHATQDDM